MNPNKLLIKYATRGRPAMFMAAMRNIAETIGTADYKILISCDENDSLMNNNAIREFVSKQKNTQIIFGKSESKIDAINRDMEAAGEWCWLVNMSDDMKFIVKGWDVLMTKQIRGVWGDSLDYFAHFSDGYTHDKLPTMSIMGREYYERDGYIYYPEYKSFSCDAEAMFVAMMRGRYHYFSDVYYHHDHPGNTPTIRSDDLYKYNGRFGQWDVELYFSRRSRLFDVPNPVVIPYNPAIRS